MPSEWSDKTQLVHGASRGGHSSGVVVHLHTCHLNAPRESVTE